MNKKSCSGISNRKKVQICLLGNLITLLVVATVVWVFKDPKSVYFRWGPSEDLIVISVAINNWVRWFLVLVFIGLISACEALVNELGSPILGFRVYNPDCKVINDFGRYELNIMTNSMWFINSFRGVLMTVVSVTQIDIAFAGVLVSEISSIFTVWLLLKEKKFDSRGSDNDEYEKMEKGVVDLNEESGENNAGEELELMDNSS